jgi:hypothetical protein
MKRELRPNEKFRMIPGRSKFIPFKVGDIVTSENNKSGIVCRRRITQLLPGNRAEFEIFGGHSECPARYTDNLKFYIKVKTKRKK